MANQPYLSKSSVTLSAPVQWWSDATGQTDGARPDRGIEGIYCNDTRSVIAAELEVTSHPWEHVSTSEPGGGSATFHHVLRTPDLGADPTLLLARNRQVIPTGARESFLLSNTAESSQDVTIELTVHPDATPMGEVKEGEPPRPLHGIPEPTDESASWSWREDTVARLRVSGGTIRRTPEGFLLAWSITVPARGTATAGWELDVQDRSALLAPSSQPPLEPPPAPRADPRVTRLLTKSFADINALRVSQRGYEDEPFLAAGAPWFLTLFGRDSLIAASFLLEKDPATALATLRVLARFQGNRHDPQLAEDPGKIMHEIRGTTMRQGDEHEVGQFGLPPLYYGTIDATALWINLLADVARAGAADEDVRDLLPALHAALRWLRDDADSDGDGFIEYEDLSGHGLANQGWKDSGDSIRFADGSRAAAPVVLCEVQGYAYAAARNAAWLLETYENDLQAARDWRQWADDLAVRFRARFWAEDDLGRYPVLALDGAKQQVDGVASNMGHLLGTGILSHDEATEVVRRLMHPTMNSGYGVRTLSTTNGGYTPTGYHAGSVWTHDTAYIIRGMVLEGFQEEARTLAEGLLRAAEGFDYRLPELFGGGSDTEFDPPQRYPAACRPQAWAATAALVIAAVYE